MTDQKKPKPVLTKAVRAEIDRLLERERQAMERYTDFPRAGGSVAATQHFTALKAAWEAARRERIEYLDDLTIKPTPKGTK